MLTRGRSPQVHCYTAIFPSQASQTKVMSVINCIGSNASTPSPLHFAASTLLIKREEVRFVAHLLGQRLLSVQFTDRRKGRHL